MASTNRLASAAIPETCGRPWSAMVCAPFGAIRRSLPPTSRGPPATEPCEDRFISGTSLRRTSRRGQQLPGSDQNYHSSRDRIWSGAGRPISVARLRLQSCLLGSRSTPLTNEVVGLDYVSAPIVEAPRSEEHTSELQSPMYL